jgi:hypothetical protein
LLTVSRSFMNVANSVLWRMASILKANKVNLFVSSVLFVFWYHSPNFLDTPPWRASKHKGTRHRCSIYRHNAKSIHIHIEICLMSSFAQQIVTNRKSSVLFVTAIFTPTINHKFALG